MRHLDLFSGIGGFALAARWSGIETIQFVEIEPYAQKVLKKNFPGVPIHDDIKTFKANEFRGIEFLTGGYPCQPFSSAGKQRGSSDDRHLWPEMLRVIREARPHWIIAENVFGHIKLGLDKVLFDLESEAYSTRGFIVPACAVDAPHRRDRIWIVAHNSSDRRNKRWRGFAKTGSNGIVRDTRWKPEPGVDRVVHGISNRMDRLRGLGNAIVPQVALQIFKSILKTEER